ncbi:MAG: hypothetical protein L3K17_05980 [Thermoplasmata archaeon]|nr:hypothetical protein [Thermoplasmata archaeon]
MSSAPAGPPCEWVEGDAVRAAQFGLITGALLGGLSCLLSISLFQAAGVWAGPPFGLLTPVWGPLFLWVILGPELVIIYYFPRRFPVIGRLGISPAGMRLAFPLASFNLPWTSVDRIGPDWIEVSPFIGSVRYRLTPYQSYRLRVFLTPH